MFFLWRKNYIIISSFFKYLVVRILTKPHFLPLYQISYKGNLCGYDNETKADYSNGITTNPRISQKLSKQWHVIDYYSYQNKNFYKQNGICLTGCPTKTNLKPIDKTDLLCKDEKDILLSMPQCIDYSSSNHTTKRYRMYSNPNYLVACGACMYQVESLQLYDRCYPLLNKDVIKYRIENTMMELNSIIKQEMREIEENLIKNINNTYSSYNDLISMLSSSSIKYHDSNDDIISSFSTFIERFTRDIWMYKYIISTFAFAGTTCLCHFLLFIIRRASSKLIISIFIWMICFITPILLVLLGIFCFILSSQEDGGYESRDNNNLRITSYVVWTISFMVLSTILVLRKRVRLAAGIVKTCANVMSDLPNVIYYPLSQIFAYVILFIVPWYIILMYLTTVVIIKHEEYIKDNENEYNELNKTIQISW